MGEQRAIRYTQADIARAAKGMKQAEIADYTLRIDPNGNIEIVVTSTPATIKRGSSWDDVLAR